MDRRGIDFKGLRNPIRRRFPCRPPSASYSSHPPISRRRAWPSPSFHTLLRWQERATERHLLAGLGDHALKDVGLSRADIEQEASKPFWRG